MAVPPPHPEIPPSGMLPADAAKPALRERLRQRRADHVAALGEAGCDRAAHDAAAHVLPHVADQAIVALYLPIGDELDPLPLADALHARGQRLAMPWLVDRTAMLFRTWTPGDPVERGPFRLRQPLGDAEPLVPEIIVTPLLGVTRAGGRIGQGAGHYDRAFARWPGARRIGFGWSVQEESELPHDPWDAALDAIATELEWIVTTAARTE